jgi:Integrase core domain
LIESIVQAGPSGVSARAICGALGLSRATYYRRQAALAPKSPIEPEVGAPHNQPTERSQRGALIGVAVCGHGDQSATAPQSVASLLIMLDVAKSHSRPHVSDDNPFSEAQFKTLKYRPNFPERFASLEHARRFLRELFAWYNKQHRHSRLALLTPHDVHHGLVDERVAHRARVLDAAYAAKPERFVLGAPAPRRPPATVWINPPKPNPATEEARA